MRNNEFNKIELTGLYKDNRILEAQRLRFRSLEKYFNDNFVASEPLNFTSPGRIEIGGNHTDHNNGLILASAIDTDTIAVAQKNSLNRINLISRNLDSRFSVDLGRLQPVAEEKGTTSALMRGMAAKFISEGHKVGGFDCVLESDIAIGSGLSSSASIEVMIGTILKELYNGGLVSPIEVAKYGQYAENNFFGKPCGLMDQLSIAVGGIVFVDFLDKENPKVEKLNINFSDYGFETVIVNTGATHADLTDDYAAIPSEMKSVAGYFGQSLCRFISRSEVVDNMRDLRNKLDDRAVLRALHFLEENERVEQEVQALKKGEIDHFMALIKESGNSSFKFLQNIYSNKNYREQSVSIALEATEYYLKRNSSRGSCRVHGGGFAGTILAFMEPGLFDGYMELVNSVLGPNSALKVQMRESGACRIIL